jgi:Glycosyl hydrolases family 2, TIM barrel domain/Glycosyl hydrolases family 2, sugar binding domain/Glycosyl hydrolases family 2
VRLAALAAPALVAGLLYAAPAQEAPAPKPALRTRWTDDVSRAHPWPEHPRPDLQRDRWQSLNGPWEHAVRAQGSSPPERWDGPILVPFPIESQLSGVGRVLLPDEELWYRRELAVPSDWPDGRVLLHFGAVDWQARVLLDGRAVGSHAGGYDPFTLDLGRLAPETRHELVVAVRDPTDTGSQPRGKQTLRPGGIWYTPVSGIWQTVWWEPVPELALDAVRVEHQGGERLRLVASIDGGGRPPPGDLRLEARVLHEGREVARAAGPAPAFDFTVDGLELWSPASPTLYDLELTLFRGEEPLDRVQSYFGARTIEVRPDEDGTPRLFLNGEPLFEYGLLDQGWWPDGLYCAPNDEALAYDLEVAKGLGFNMMRKHVKVEPARWYWHADRLGLFVWQDIPSGGRGIGPEGGDLDYGAQDAAEFQHEAERIVDALRAHPSVVCWVLFNEGWGQHDTAALAAWLAADDPTRVVDAASGWADRGVGQLADVHCYPGPGMPEPGPPRAAVLGEFGGLGLPLAGHAWVAEAGWGYRSYASRDALVDAYLERVAELRPLQARGLAAAVYTQTTDVETEVNGVMTYDRAVLKLDDPRVRAAHALLFRPPPRVETLLPTAEQAPAVWRYRLEPPADTWMQPGFDDAGWAEGTGGFGTEGTPGARVGTRWDGAVIWLRRRFELAAPPAGGALCLRIHHDEDAEVFLNGVPIAALSGFTTDYVGVPLDAQASAALRDGPNVLAVRCRQTQGGQYVDAGLEILRERDEPTSGSGADSRSGR